MATEQSDDRIAQFEAEIERLRAAVAGLAGACRAALERHRYPVADGRGGARPMSCGCDTCRDLRAALDAHAGGDGSQSAEGSES